MNMVCKCGGKEFFTEEHGNQTGLYCSACGKWQKWLKKDEIRLFNHGVKVENASLLERLKARIEESAIKVSTVKAPHTYMKAVGTRELEKILEEELGNDILAEYVRSRYPEIEKTFDFAAYSAGVALKEFGRCIKEAFGGTDKEVDDVCDSEH